MSSSVFSEISCKTSPIASYISSLSSKSSAPFSKTPKKRDILLTIYNLKLMTYCTQDQCF